jgi:hypothetical protein
MMDDYRRNGNVEARMLLVWVLSRMDLRLAHIERATGLPEEWQFVEINQLAETMGLESGYDRIQAAAHQVMAKRKIPTLEGWR